MPIHEQFEQLCALAAAGEMNGAEAESLKDHLEECASCRSVLMDFNEIHAQWLPSHPAFDELPHSHVETRLRGAILRQARAEGAQFSDAASTGMASTTAPVWSFCLRFSAVTALVLLCGVLGTLLWTHAGADKKYRPSSNSRESASSVASAKQTGEEVVLAEQKVAQAEHSLALFRSEVSRLRKELQDEQLALSAMAQSKSLTENRVAELESELSAAQRNEADLESELHDAKVKVATSDAVAVAEQGEVERLRSDAVVKMASLEREREMLSQGGEIRDLIAARNLHIIDVYDTNVDGRTSKAFGRVFYTEGKSLVFYAYDLASHHASTAKFAFYLWGKRDGAPQYVKVLGQLNRDDQQQKRWALTITDSNVLAEIDSVFVTLEPAGNDASKPTGKPLLSAFLGSPANHP